MFSPFSSLKTSEGQQMALACSVGQTGVDLGLGDRQGGQAGDQNSTQKSGQEPEREDKRIQQPEKSPTFYVSAP